LFIDIKEHEDVDFVYDEPQNMDHIDYIIDNNYLNASYEVRRIIDMPNKSKFEQMMRGKLIY